MRRWTAAALTALALTACDGGGGDAEPDPTPTTTTTTATAAPGAVRDGIAALYAGDQPTPDQLAEADCFVDALLERLDADDLVAAGIVRDDGAVVPVLPVFDEATAREWVAAQGTCADFVETSSRALVAQSKGKVAADVYAACLRETLTGDAIEAALVDTLTGAFDTAEVGALSEAQARCARSASPPE